MIYEFVSATLHESAGVSDIHLTCNEAPWVRLNGRLASAASSSPVSVPAYITDSEMRVFLARIAPWILDPQSALEEIESNERMSSRDEARTGIEFGADVDGLRLRCNLSFANGGLMSLVIRRLNDHIPNLASLGLPDTIAKQVEKPVGLMLVTGPTGSGKSTTLASIMDHLNGSVEGHILTIEDPVEYLLPQRRCKVTRKEIGKDAGSFLAALRAAMRQDPDIIMIGEIRDRETMRAAMSAAETGHLVLGTLHTNSAPKTIDRVLSFFPADDKEWARGAFASSLNCIIAQTLVPKKDGSGRALAFEVMINTPDIRSTIAENRLQQITNQMEQGRGNGQVLMHLTLGDLVRKGVVTEAAATAAAYDPVRFRKEIGR